MKQEIDEREIENQKLRLKASNYLDGLRMRIAEYSHGLDNILPLLAELKADMALGDVQPSQ